MSVNSLSFSIWPCHDRFRSGKSGLQSNFCHSLAPQPLKRHLTSLSFIFLTIKMRITRQPHYVGGSHGYSMWRSPPRTPQATNNVTLFTSSLLWTKRTIFCITSSSSIWIIQFRWQILQPARAKSQWSGLLVSYGHRISKTKLDPVFLLLKQDPSSFPTSGWKWIH